MRKKSPSLNWETVAIASVGDFEVWVFADGTWELNDDGMDGKQGQETSPVEAKRAALGELARFLRWSRGARYLGRKYAALIVPHGGPEDPLLPRKFATWSVESRHPVQALTSWGSSGKGLAQGTAPSVAAAKRAVERLLQMPRRKWKAEAA